MYDLKGKDDLEMGINGDLLLEKTPGTLFEKAVISPKGYIGIEYAPNQSIDNNYGNAVYYKINENLTSALLADAGTDVKEAISYVNVPTTNVEATIDSLSTIKYLITYTDKTTQEIVINV